MGRGKRPVRFMRVSPHSKTAFLFPHGTCPQSRGNGRCNWYLLSHAGTQFWFSVLLMLKVFFSRFFFLATTLFTTSHLWSEGVSSGGGNKEEVIQKQALVFRRRPHLLRSRMEHKRPFAVTKDDVLLTNVYTLEKVCSAWSAVSSPQNNRLLHQSLLVERKTTTQWCIFFNKMLSHVDCSYES